eukprot:9226832-Pyramimonas_sp.AAC.2
MKAGFSSDARMQWNNSQWNSWDSSAVQSGFSAVSAYSSSRWEGRSSGRTDDRRSPMGEEQSGSGSGTVGFLRRLGVLGLALGGEEQRTGRRRALPDGRRTVGSRQWSSRGGSAGEQLGAGSGAVSQEEQ